MKKILIIIISIIVLSLGGVGGYYLVTSRTKGDTNLNTSGEQTITEKVTADISYKDESGFSFKYPRDIKVTDVTPEGDEYYSQLDLIKGDGKITITLKDSAAKSIDNWINTNSEYSGAKLVGAAELAGTSAKQYSLGNKMFTISLDKGILYLIEGAKDGGYWEEAHNVVVSSFAFGNKPAESGSSSQDSGAIYEEEEIVE